jgi:hypothetical protein
LDERDQSGPIADFRPSTDPEPMLSGAVDQVSRSEYLQRGGLRRSERLLSIRRADCGDLSGPGFGHPLTPEASSHGVQAHDPAAPDG